MFQDVQRMCFYQIVHFGLEVEVESETSILKYINSFDRARSR